MQSLLDYLSIALILIDREQTIQYLNPACEMLLGSSLNQLHGQPLHRHIIHPGGWDRLIKRTRYGNTLIERDSEISLTHHQQTLDADIAITETPEDQLLLEIQPLSRAHAIARTNERQQQVAHNRLLIRNLAHEIRNPLAGIKGAAQRLSDIEPPNQEKYIELIVSQVDRLNRLLITMSGEGKPAFQQSNIHRALEESIELTLQDPKHQQLQISRIYDPSLPDLEIDNGQMQQVFNNLLNNAAKAQDYQGEIQIITTIIHQYTLNGHRHKSVLGVKIIDHGCGIPEHLQTAIFQPMISHFRQGSGLGLAISQGIVHQHGGAIELTSNAQETVFSVILPFIRSPS